MLREETTLREYRRLSLELAGTKALINFFKLHTFTHKNTQMRTLVARSVGGIR